ncbi:phage-like element PBSX protein xkdQ [Lachnospiraceae bacterium KM106-2]|nr:phage-like element PBSX protein xkdQ [Lachnospiraceae bacterium KM106-2]
MGDRLKLLTDEGIVLIDSMVYEKEVTDEQGTITYTGYDDLKHIVKSNLMHNYKKTTPERITKSVCKELGVSIGNIAKTNVPIKKLIIDGGGYEAIMKAYTKAHHENNKKYMPLMVGRKLNVIEKGSLVRNFHLDDSENITNSSYTQRLEDMVNVVKIYNDKGKCIGEIKNKNNIAKYGKFQEVYQKEEGVNPKKGAKSLLQGMTKEASINAIGNVQCISGFAINICDSATGLIGKYWIESDSHTWQSGNYTMQLNLEFKNLMDVQEEE